MPPSTMAAVTPPPTAAPRLFGRFELRQMLGRSMASSTWLAWDPRAQQDMLLCVPRAQPANVAEREEWTQDVLSAARLKHPHLAEALEVGSHDGWPFLTVARQGGMTLLERLQTSPPPTPLEVANWSCELLEGLAYAHEAGVAHQDIGLHTVLIDKAGHASLVGLGAGLVPLQPGQAQRTPRGRQEIRKTTERDVLMAGLLLHRLLANHPALDDADLYSAANRVGAEIVRLPWTTPHPVPETLRSIVNRATDRQHRQRYLNARTLLSALQGWVKTNATDSGGPLALLLDRLNSVGSLPGRPDTERGFIAALSADSLRVDDFVDVMVKNPALVWELMRAVNTAGYTSTSSDDGVTTLSRAVLLLGQKGLRQVQAAVRSWPGVLTAMASMSTEAGQAAMKALEDELRNTCLAGHIARLMAPFSIHDEEASIAAMSQRLSWLLVLYHFPDEALQIQRLTQAAPASEPGGQATQGMSLEAAAGAVLGINLDDLSAAVMRHWGLHERLVQAARPLGLQRGVRHPANPDDILRTVASMANEVVNATALQGPKFLAAMQQVHLRYARPLELGPKECGQALERAIRLVDNLPPVEATVSGMMSLG
ncbi:HDOD domain-containing protein [Aquabacterium sp.]|uniref:serine/threonine protein kinase n=1 Tax=Aquabacterium sp. TaxID=1872578 RepID=UPI002486E353|nr:HDOD domain-containing protein [Aquabacterium sp.]MDI1348190.1 HDOD domain-containing protein [Aquabacterium sp.]